MELTLQQARAAHAVNSIVVTAGAGTGKTAMLAERFRHHVETDDLRPIEIVAVTFTDKAAAELRQRIRKTLAQSLDNEDLIAEVDAAQISTIHALAARVCRDFYHLAGIPPDFQILLETESAIWLADNFDTAMGEIDETIISELGYSWLKDAIGQLLLDPHSTHAALSRGETEWCAAVEVAATDALASLTNSDSWRDAQAILSRQRGSVDDKLEAFRTAAIDAIAKIEGGDLSNETLSVFNGFRSNFGSAKNWNGGLEETRRNLSGLRDAFKEWSPLITMKFGPLDLIAAERIKLLQNAFTSVHNYLIQQKKHDKVLDFVDLEIFAREILQDERARKYYAKRWRAFLVDEFQDTNPLQAEIIDLLRSDAKLTIVGDEKQSIYSFRRADVAVFREARTRIVADGGESVELSETFRAHEALVVMMNDMFAPVLGELHRPLDASRKESPIREIPLSLAKISDDEKISPDVARIVESRYIASEIARLLNGDVTIFDNEKKELRSIEPLDIAILSRTWAAIDVYIDALSAAGIPAVNAGGGSLLDTREAKDALAMLSFLADTADDISLVALLRSPFFAISDRILFGAAQSKQKDQTWWRLIRSSEGDLRKAVDILSDLMAKKNKISPEELLREADAATGYTAVIANLPQGDRREADWTGFLSLLRKLSVNGRSDLFGAVRQVKALTDVKNSIPRPPLDAGNAISLMTIHNAKGLEWPVVFVPDLSGQIGAWSDKLLIDCEIGIAFEMEDEASNKAKPAIYELIKKRIKTLEREEEKRLLYVAVTRARDRVILTSGPAKKGTLIELLMPGVTAANVPITLVPFAENMAIPPTPSDPPPFELPSFMHTGSVSAGLRTIPISGLTEYARCPLKFRYMYVEGHPGLGEGEARARTIGTLAHKALEFDIDDFENLNRLAEDSSPENVNEALDLSRRFRVNDIFSRFRGIKVSKETSVLFNHNNADLTGVVDFVGDDFVLDYKTDAEIEPQEHRFQLWAYAAALGKPTAFIAYLRKPYLHEYSPKEIAETAKAADHLIENIAAGKFDADPSIEKCTRCVYSSICSESAARARVLQLELFN